MEPAIEFTNWKDEHVLRKNCCYIPLRFIIKVPSSITNPTPTDFQYGVNCGKALLNQLDVIKWQDKGTNTVNIQNTPANAIYEYSTSVGPNPSDCSFFYSSTRNSYTFTSPLFRIFGDVTTRDYFNKRKSPTKEKASKVQEEIKEKPPKKKKKHSKTKSPDVQSPEVHENDTQPTTGSPDSVNSNEYEAGDNNTAHAENNLSVTKEIADLKKWNQTTEVKWRESQARLKETEGRLLDSSGRLASTEKQLQDCQRKLSESEAVCDEAELIIANLEKEVRTLKENSSKHNNTANPVILVQEKAVLEQKLATLQGICDKLTIEVQAKTDNASFRKIKEKLDEQHNLVMEQSKTEIQKLKMELQTANDKLSKGNFGSHGDLQQLRRENETCKKELSVCKKEMLDAKEKFRSLEKNKIVVESRVDGLQRKLSDAINLLKQTKVPVDVINRLSQSISLDGHSITYLLARNSQLENDYEELNKDLDNFKARGIILETRNRSLEEEIKALRKLGPTPSGTYTPAKKHIKSTDTPNT